MPRALLVLLLGCHASPDDVGDTDSDTEPVDTVVVETDVADTEVPVDPVVRGAYLVDAVAACGECHTPDAAHPLAGAAVGDVWAPNLTTLGSFTDDELLAAITRGVAPDGRPLDPSMPSWLYGHLTDDDGAAIVAFLRTLSPVDGEDGPPPATSPLVPVPRLPLAAIPVSTLTADDPVRASADHGRYLGTLGRCVDCHSPTGLPLYPLDTAALLTGRPGDGPVAGDLTPDATGLAGWTAEDVARAVQDGVGPDGELCPGMPRRALSDEDALALGRWLTTVDPVAGTPSACPSAR